MMDEMNEVDEFMSKFPADVETKWGLSIDSNLGPKVKVTILATGFGLNSVTGMEEHKEEDDEDRAERRSVYYPQACAAVPRPTATKYSTSPQPTSTTRRSFPAST